MAGELVSIGRRWAGGSGVVEARRPERTRTHITLCEVIEGRAVLSHSGGLGPVPGGSLARVGVLTTAADVQSAPSWGAGTALQRGLANLKAELSALAAKAAVTVADLFALTADEQAIRDTGFRPDTTALDRAVRAIALAVAGGTDQTTAKADFAAVFRGSSRSTAAIERAHSGIVRVVTDSKRTTDDLSRIAADRAAVQADRYALRPVYGPATGSVTTTATGTGISTYHGAGHSRGHARLGRRGLGRRRF